MSGHWTLTRMWDAPVTLDIRAAARHPHPVPGTSRYMSVTIGIGLPSGTLLPDLNPRPEVAAVEQETADASKQGRRHEVFILRARRRTRWHKATYPSI